MSATLSMASFLEYFEMYDIPTGTLAIEGRTCPVEQYFLDDILPMVDYFKGEADFSAVFDSSAATRGVNCGHLVFILSRA